jgi:rubrerythrin
MNDNLISALSKALAMEEKGYKFYQDTSAKSKNSITKKTFDFLADNEILHIENIKKFYIALEKKGAFPEVDWKSIKEKRSKDATLFSQNIAALKEKVAPAKDDTRALEFAMELENSGYKYYEAMLKDTKDKNLSAFLKFLLEEESQHYQWIQNTYTYITDSANWNMYEEKAFPQG